MMNKLLSMPRKKALLVLSGLFLFCTVLGLILSANKPVINPVMAYQGAYFKSFGDFNLLGFSPLGEKMSSLLIWGYWQTVSAALFGRFLAIVLSFAGLALAWLGGKYGRSVITRLSEALMTIPSLLLALSLGYLIGEGYFVMILVIAVSEWAFNQKWMLGRLSEYNRNSFIEAARAMGAGKRHILIRHFLPMIFSDLSLLFFLYLPGSLLTVSTLEFLGVSSGGSVSGIGSLIALNKDLVFIYPHVILPPMVLLVLTVYLARTIKNKFFPIT